MPLRYKASRTELKNHKKATPHILGDCKLTRHLCPDHTSKRRGSMVLHINHLRVAPLNLLGTLKYRVIDGENRSHGVLNSQCHPQAVYDEARNSYLLLHLLSYTLSHSPLLWSQHRSLVFAFLGYCCQPCMGQFCIGRSWADGENCNVGYELTEFVYWTYGIPNVWLRLVSRNIGAGRYFRACLILTGEEMNGKTESEVLKGPSELLAQLTLRT